MKTFCILFFVMVCLYACEKNRTVPPTPEVSSARSVADDFSEFKKKDESCSKDELPPVPVPQETVQLQGANTGCKNQ